MSLNIDKEWANFISSSFDDDISDDEDIINNFVNSAEEFVSANLSMEINSETPKASDIYISTKTKIAYLNMPIEVRRQRLISRNMPGDTLERRIQADEKDFANFADFDIEINNHNF